MKAILAALALLAVAQSTSAGNKMVCYFGSWAVYRPGAGKFDVENIDPTLCTHIIYGFTGLQGNTMVALDSWNDLYDNWGKGAMNRFVALKKKNPALKVSLAIGGWNEGSQKYSQMASTSSNRAQFIQSVISFLQNIGFDGLDLDWEYPANRDGNPVIDKANFVSLVQEMKAAFAPLGLMLTAAVSCGYSTIDTAYNVPAIAAALDQIHLMCYDFHGAWEPFTGHNAPLYVNPTIDTGDNATWNADYAVNYWLNKGAPASKLILGLPLYGRGFTLDNTAKNGMYAPASNPIPAGPYTREAGFWGYNEICTNLVQGGWTVVNEPYYQSPYMYKGNLWMGYDDANSLAKKTQYVLSKGLGGAMVWSLETDDFSGSCYGTPFILIKSIVSTLNGGTLPTVPTPDPSLTTTTKATTAAPTPAPSDVCKTAGYNRDPNNCGIFYNCVANGAGWTVYTYTCPSGTAFDLTSASCTWPYLVPGCDGSATTAAPAATTTTATTTTTKSTAATAATTTTVATAATTKSTAATAATTTTVATAATTKSTAATAATTTTTTGCSATTTAGTTTTVGPTLPTTTATLVPNPICTSAGYVRDPNDCAVFYQCISNGQGGWTMYTFRCASGTVFNPTNLSCAFPNQVPGCENYTG